MIRVFVLLSMGGFLLVALLSAGCATSAYDSDLPWNTPQPWEGVMPLPSGMRME